MNNIVVVLNKTNTNDVSKELVQCLLTYDFLCLSRTQKWCSEILCSMDEETTHITEDLVRFNHTDVRSMK